MNVPERISRFISEGRPVGLGYSPEGVLFAYAFPDRDEVLWSAEAAAGDVMLADIEGLLEERGFAFEILRNRAQCPLCGEVVESRWRHDFRSCGCGSISVDGGQGYLRRAYREELPLERSDLVWRLSV